MTRLPTPGSDDGLWGQLLNNYLMEQHNADGTHKVRSMLQAPASSGQVMVSNPAATDGIGWQALSPSVVGLSNVNNTSDADKPVSTAQQAALNQKVSQAQAIAFAVCL